jgi:hypothetical protein
MGKIGQPESTGPLSHQSVVGITSPWLVLPGRLPRITSQGQGLVLPGVPPIRGWYYLAVVGITSQVVLITWP